MAIAEGVPLIGFCPWSFTDVLINSRGENLQA
jgi:hypothetical protein